MKVRPQRTRARARALFVRATAPLAMVSMLAMAIAGCSDDKPRSREGPTNALDAGGADGADIDATTVGDAAPEDAGTDGASGEDANVDAAVGEDASSDSAADVSAVLCTSLVDGAGAVAATVVGAAPTMTGGSVADGTFVLTKVETTGTVPPGDHTHGTYRFAAGQFEYAASGITERGSVLEPPTGSTLQLVVECPTPVGSPFRTRGFTANASMFVEQIAGAGGATVTRTFSLQVADGG